MSQRATRLMAIDAAGPNSDSSYDVLVEHRCRRVTVQEDYDSVSAATTDLRMKMPKGADDFIKIPQGTPAIFTPVGRTFFETNEVAGVIKARTGSINVQILESNQV